MAIPENQLATWAQQGSTTGSAAAYASVNRAIDQSGLKALHAIDVYLQGSYRNSTNIAKESDVDVVVNCHESFFSTTDLLAGAQLTKVKALADATYTWDQFRNDVKDALVSYFGTARVKDKDKCLEVASAGGTGISADVVPALDYRLYRSDGSWIEGIAFLTRTDRRRIVGFPKLHYENGVKKQKETNDEFKPTVRVFKNAGAEMVDRVLLYEGDAPSYFIECLVYNVPANQFVGSSWQDQTVSVFNWLQSADKSRFVCVNGVYRLFGPGQWTLDMADRFISQFAKLWNNW
jgi:hypothetical protein